MKELREPTLKELFFKGHLDVQIGRISPQVSSLLGTLQTTPQKDIDWRDNTVSPAYKLARVAHGLLGPPSTASHPSGRQETFDVFETSKLTPEAAAAILLNLSYHNSDKPSHLPFLREYFKHFNSERSLPTAPGLTLHFTPHQGLFRFNEFTIGFTKNEDKPLQAARQWLEKDIMAMNEFNTIGIGFPPTWNQEETLREQDNGHHTTSPAIQIGVRDTETMKAIRTHPKVKFLEKRGFGICININGHIGPMIDNRILTSPEKTSR